MVQNFKQQQKIREIESFLLCNYEDAQAAVRWLSKQSIELQIWASKESSAMYLLTKKKNLDTSKEIISIVASLKTACRAYDTYKKAHRKNAQFEGEDIILVDAMEANLFFTKRRVSKKREFLQRKFFQIKKWRELGISYQAIAAKLITIDGEIISPEYIRKFVLTCKEML